MTGPLPGDDAPATIIPAEPTSPPRNGLATASLVLGILGVSVIGLILGIVGLGRAKKVGRGKGKALVGIILSVLWLAGQITVGVYIGTHVAKAADPGCVAVNAFVDNDKAFDEAAGSPENLKAEFQRIVAGLRDSAAKSNNSEARAAINKLADDFQELLDALTNATPPAEDLQTRVEADGNAVDKACGVITAK